MRIQMDRRTHRIQMACTSACTDAVSFDMHSMCAAEISAAHVQDSTPFPDPAQRAGVDHPSNTGPGGFNVTHYPSRFQPGRIKALGIEFIDGYADVDLTDKPVLSAALIQDGFEVTVSPDASGEVVVLLDADLDGTGDNLPEAIDGDAAEKTCARKSQLPCAMRGLATSVLQRLM